jgi:ABC-type nitrate/sulfonate/bicarbonate transport system substrate-binding protein
MARESTGLTMKMGLAWGAALLATVFVALGGYFWLARDVAAPRESNTVRDTVRLGIAREELSSLAMIAQEQGYYSAEGLDVVVKEYPSGRLALEGMFASEVDLATVAEVPIVFSSFQRDDFRIVGTVGGSSNQPRIIARRAKGIDKPEDLRGKRIATQKASAVHFFLHVFLVKHGLSEKDVLLSFKSPNELVDALISGEIDAFSMREPFVSRAKTALGEEAVVFAEPGLYATTVQLVAPQSFIASNPEAIRKVLRAAMRAEEFARENSDQAIKLVSKWLGTEQSTTARLWQDLQLGVSLEQALLVSMDDEARWAIQSKLTDKAKVPNYLAFVYLDGLSAVRQQVVNIIR